MKNSYKQKFLEDWQTDMWIQKNKKFLWFTFVAFITALILSSFGNPLP